MNPEVAVGIALTVTVLVMLVAAISVHCARRNPGKDSNMQERQEIVYFEPSDKFVASVDGVYLKRDWQTDYVQQVAVIGGNVLQHHATFCGAREEAEALLRQWNAQKLRAHHTVTPYQP